MKMAFIDKRFSKKSLEIIERANMICADYARQGYDLSLRQLYYQFVRRNWIVNCEASYKNLGNVINDARLTGLLDWKYIKDRGRTTETNSHWKSPAEIMQAVAEQFKIDTWKYQPNHVEVLVEKQALEGILEPVCKRLDVGFTANKGYSSVSSMFEIGQRLKGKMYDEKHVHILYLGDHDPSGIDMTRDVEKRLMLLSEAEKWGMEDQFHMHRLALNMDQVEQYNPPENPAKVTDSRYEKYMEEFGEASWELDALEPSVLAGLVTDKVIALRSEDVYEAAMLKQEGWRDALHETAQGGDFTEEW